MDLTRNRRYALVSAASPIIAFVITIIYQSISNGEFWDTVSAAKSGDNTAGAMMAFTETIQIAVALLIGFIIGVVFSAFSIKANNANYKLGYISLAFNIVPLVLVTMLLLKGVVYGF
jgi:hypothetical protein